MNTDTYFVTVEKSDVLRADANEGVDETWQFKKISIQDKSGKWVEIGGAQSPLMYRHGDQKSRNILCMYMFTDKADFEFDSRNLDFGDTAVIITDLKEFLRRFKLAADNIGKRLWHGPIQYVDKSYYHGQMGPFRKFSDYEYQSEFRFVLFGESGAPSLSMKFSIGDIRDIARTVPSSLLPEFPKPVS
ncbi:hypothetical protein PZ78_00750 [Vreelandella venusta]|nr:hypothetical protein PZ78_00750 [Halomonas hydrothermalis]